ncbi:MAG: hypothetical protein EPN48_12090 [Microbacteriaceae bacterium]|nr:MAG: hypothetical protein EPN48_12090 [Microbacteriaceae bacterium]
MPQRAACHETGHDNAALELTRSGASALTIVAETDSQGRRPGFTLTRHTAQQVTAAAHPYELPTSDTSYLYLDAAQHGLGSRACGPDVWPDFTLRPGARTLTLRFGRPQRVRECRYSMGFAISSTGSSSVNVGARRSGRAITK